MSRIELQTNEDGIAKFCPVTAFDVRIATNEMVIVVIQYVETVEQFDSGQLRPCSPVWIGTTTYK